MSNRKPKFDEVLDGVRVRVYATKGEYEALRGDGDIDNPQAFVWCYPRIGPPDAWAAQARLQYRVESEKTP